MFNKVEDAVTWMEERRFITKGIDAFRSYMEVLGNPQLKVPCIHIAGTNGKGSTLHYMSCMLQEAGYRIGTFSSPYLETHFDRICINHETINQNIFLEIVNSHYEEWIAHKLNMFEIDFVIAALYFAREKVDFAIYEVGLGGRFDATNAVQPLVSIITNIGMDHMELLGNTYEQIAEAKAGIIKAEAPLITAEKKPECLQVFRKECSQTGSSMILADKAEHVEASHDLAFRYGTLDVYVKATPVYQVDNISCALEAVYYLKKQQFLNISEEQMKRGIRHSHWKGRFEIMKYDPLVIVDGAHNKEGIQALCASMKDYTDIHIIFSALKDKDHDAMLEALLSISDDITVCEFGFYRGTTCEELARQYPVAIERDYRKAIDQMMKKKGTVLITGSLYFISDVRKYLKNSYHCSSAFYEASKPMSR